MLHRDLKKVKEAKRAFYRISDDYDNALQKNAQSVRTKPTEAEESLNVLSATRTAFSHTALDYVFQVCNVHVHLALQLVRCKCAVGGGGGGGGGGALGFFIGVHCC